MTLRELREKKKLTQEQVAERGPMEQTTVSQLELGKIPDPRTSTLQKLAAVYGVKLQAIVDALAATLDEKAAA